MLSRITFTFPILMGIFLAMTTTSLAQLQSPLDIALRHLEQNQKELQLTKSDLSNYIVSDLYTSKHNGVTHVYLNQHHNEIILRNAITNVNILPNGKVLNMGNRFVTDLQSRVNTTSASISPEQAVQKVISHFQISPTATLKLYEKVNDHHFIFENEGIALEPITVKLVFELLDDESIRLAWNVALYKLDAQHLWVVRIDAQTGAILTYHDNVIHCDFGSPKEKCDEEGHQYGSKKSNKANINNSKESQKSTTVANSYNVFPMPVESPNHGDRALVTDPANIIASPFGWHDTDGAIGPEYTITRGNNVHAYQDIFDNNETFEDEPDGGNSLDFDFPLDLGPNQPYTQIPPAVVNLFYWNNVIHDVWYQYGFDEVSGNFQVNNYGNGGLGEDHVRAEALDGGGTNNANMSTSIDGNPPRMQMYIWTDEPLPGGDLPQFTVTAPAGVAGEYDMVPADFGPPLPEIPLVSEVVIIYDGVGNVTDACDPITNGVLINGKIALLDSGGGCQFGSKVLNAQNNGAIAVIVCNDNFNPPFSMPPGDDGDMVTIPSIMISLPDCNLLRVNIPGLTVSLQESEVTVTVPMPGPTGIDGDFDNGIIIHEYTHGISNRLTGGPAAADCLRNFEQAGEGWSDWFALVMVTTSSNTADQKRGIGTYAIEEPVVGTGLRDFPYSRDMSIDPHTYAAIDTVAVPHGVGSVWAVMIWDLYWNLIDEYGFDEDFYNGTGGNNMAMQLVLDGLKLQACRPTFIDARDAVLAADRANYGGVNQCLIWETFARRGLGFSAQAGGIEGYDLPEFCQPILKITKSADSVAFAGDVITYTLEITNDSPSLLSNTTVMDTIPAGTSFVSGSATCANITEDNGIISINVGSMAVGESLTCSYQLLLDENPYSILLLEDDMDAGQDNWEAISDQGSVEWIIDPNSYPGDFAWFAENIDTVCDQSLMLAIPANLAGSNPLLSFWHRYNTQYRFNNFQNVQEGVDGGVVEISIDGGSTWLDLGNDMVQNGYTDTLEIGTENPLNGRLAFTGNNGGFFIETLIDLSNYSQQDMIFRFRLGCDESNGDEGWYIEKVSLFDNFYSITNKACIFTDQNETHCSSTTTTVFGNTTSTKTLSENGLEVSIFPNPTNSNVTVQLKNPSNSPANISLLNINGQVLDTKKLEYSSGTFGMNLTSYPEGIYMIQIQTDEAQLVRKVVKQ